MYSNHLAATGAAAITIGSLILPLWVVGAAFVLVGAGLLGTRLYARRHQGGQR